MSANSAGYHVNHDDPHLSPPPVSPSPSPRRHSSSYHGPTSPSRPPPSSYTFPRSSHHDEVEYLDTSAPSDFRPPDSPASPDHLSPNFPNLPGRGWGRKRANSSASIARRSISSISGLLPRRTSVSAQPPSSSSAQQPPTLSINSRIGSSTDSFQHHLHSPPIGPSVSTPTFGVPASMNSIVPPVKQRVISDRRGSSSSKMRRSSAVHSPTTGPNRVSSPVSVFSATTTSSHPPPSANYPPSHLAPPTPTITPPPPVLQQHPGRMSTYLDKSKALVDRYKREPWFFASIVVAVGVIVKILGVKGTIVALLMIASGLFARFILPPPHNHVRVAEPHPPPGAMSDSVSWM